MRKLLLALAIVALAAPAYADEDTVETADGSIAVMSSGSVYQANDGTDFSSWEGDDVTITGGGRMIDHDSGDTADVDQIQ